MGVLTASGTVTAVAPRASGVLHDHSLPTEIFTIELINSIVCIPEIIKLNKAVPRVRRGKESLQEWTLSYLCSSRFLWSPKSIPLFVLSFR